MLRVGFALSFGLILAAMAEAQSTGEAAGQLAARIFSLLQRRATVSLEFRNLTPLDPSEWLSFRSALSDELRKSGLETAGTSSPEWRVRVTLSESSRGLLLVAEVISGENRQVVMLPWNAPPLADPKPRVKISKIPIWEQPEPVLDFLLLDSGSALVVLGSSKVSSYRLASGKWLSTGIAALVLARPLARDQRGRMEGGQTGFRVYVPGTTCSGTLDPALRLTCSAGNEAWPVNPRDPGLAVRWATDRNLLETDGVRGAFYSAAPNLFAATDGRILDRAGDPISSADAWGSDVASIESPCGPSSFVLAAGAGDNPERDHVQAFEISSGRAVAASEPLGLPGRVTALWPAETRGQATLVVRNSKTGNYEASRLGVACAE